MEAERDVDSCFLKRVMRKMSVFYTRLMDSLDVLLFELWMSLGSSIVCRVEFINVTSTVFYLTPNTGSTLADWGSYFYFDTGPCGKVVGVKCKEICIKITDLCETRIERFIL